MDDGTSFQILAVQVLLAITAIVIAGVYFQQGNRHDLTKSGFKQTRSKFLFDDTEIDPDEVLRDFKRLYAADQGAIWIHKGESFREFRPTSNTVADGKSHLKQTLEGLLAVDLSSDLLHKVMAQLGVGPGMQCMLEQGVPPSMLQPVFVITAIKDEKKKPELRVTTYAFVGGPVTGVKPCDKRTPYIITMITDELLSTRGSLRVNFEVRGAAGVTEMKDFVKEFAATHSKE